MKTAEVNLEGELVRIHIYDGARVYGFGVVPGRFLEHLGVIEGI